ncbi:Cyanovirin-N [Aspergillus alliaceus]|uniref:Cyanovirin-N n=1 Tax=Petromyces alliaceus TaxID=209559 RepID=A0A5N7C2I7_PETAA|nr:Cyanovirin-N [Aspergillus alliaceus]
MSFHVTAEGVRLEEHHMLFGRLQNMQGDLIDADIDLNAVLGNNEGRFEWGGSGFLQTAEPGSVQFNLEGDEGVPVLRARLDNGQGEYFDADVNLSERIGNDDGKFTFE